MGRTVARRSGVVRVDYLPLENLRALLRVAQPREQREVWTEKQPSLRGGGDLFAVAVCPVVPEYCVS